MKLARGITLVAALVGVAAMAGCDEIAGLGRSCDYVDLYVPGTLINVGESLRFKAWVQDMDPNVDCRAVEGEGISWRSSNSSVASVSYDGWVYGEAPGRTEITAVNDRSGRTSSVTVTVVRSR